MKMFWILAIGSLVMTGCTETELAESTISEASVKLETKLDSVCYGLGIDIADNLKQQGLGNLNVEAMAKGLQDILNDSELAISKEEVGPLLNEYMGQMQAEKAKEATKEGIAYLAKNGERKEVTVLPSGLQY